MEKRGFKLLYCINEANSGPNETWAVTPVSRYLKKKKCGRYPGGLVGSSSFRILVLSFFFKD